MSEAQGPRRVLRRIGAVLAGFLAIIILSTATDMALHATGVFPPFGQRMGDALFLLALSYRIVYGVAGLVVSIAGAVVMWDAGPARYFLAVIAIAMPCAWAGGRLRGMRDG